MSRVARLRQALAKDKAHATASYTAKTLTNNSATHDTPHHLQNALEQATATSYYLETYGCQMNVADSEVVAAILNQTGYTQTHNLDTADVVLLNTCSIRENAEAKIWQRLRGLRADARKKRLALPTREERRASTGPLIGLLGCMAERLKSRLLERERLVDLVCGPDAYRSLPRLVAAADAGQPSLDVRLSLDETYADVAPVRECSDGVSAFVSIMRGCNNMCSYCIVPFTRGRERSRPADSIAAEVSALAADGYREVTLLGQNVNSYADGSSGDADAPPPLRDGFTTKVPPARGAFRFSDLLRGLARAHPEVRFRFTSPHPKDFPDDLLRVLAEEPNACQSLHMPAQSGSSAVLEAMRRGYTRETYDDLIGRVRELLPAAAISTDIIAGFCGETEEDHQQTLSLMRSTRYDKAYMFAYSMREGTNAHRKLADDVPAEVKSRRLREVIAVYDAGAREANADEVGKRHLVLVEGLSKKDDGEWIGRTDTNRKVVFARKPLPAALGVAREEEAAPGAYVDVRISESLSANTLRAEPIAISSIAAFADPCARHAHV